MRDDRLSRDKLSMPPGIKGILCIKFDLFKIKNTAFWAAYGKTGFVNDRMSEIKFNALFGSKHKCSIQVKTF